ncbi:SWIM-type domain-containing protein [Favolaschia claudopus]|uniref:SWIM-type domain-containing protein n=1 Tax=Favolaschia claudopus TaxID=2862362 RepID=A0AAV9ZKC9_9AGAR
MARNTQRCSKCHNWKEATAEFWKGTFGEDGFKLTANCRQCLDAASSQKRDARAKKNPEKENDQGAPDNTNTRRADDVSDFIGLPAMDLDAFLDALANADEISLFLALVDISALEKESVRDATDAIARSIWEKTGYRFSDYNYSYHSVHPLKNSSTSRYEYHCLQISTRQHKSKKALDVKTRDKGAMRTFDCQGWITIYASPDDDEYFVRIRHQDCHEKYACIDVPEDVRNYIEANPNLRAYQLWKEILKTHPFPAFTQKAVYNLWSKQHQSQWRRNDDELESAKILLAEFSKDPRYQVESITLPPDSGGCIALAFALPLLIRKWAGTIREAALDSTFNTTKAGYECFALLGEVFGSGLPVGFLFIKTSNPDPNQKEVFIRAFIRRLLDEWNLQIIQSLSDKDITEINALLAELPDDIKHQICFWHSLRIVKGRLAVLARRPAPYNVEEAFAEFDWIDREFLPLAQLDPELQTPDRLQVAQSFLPTVKLRFQGQAAESSAPTRPKIVINLGRQSGTTAPAPRTTEEDVSDVSSDSDAALEQFLESLDDDDEDYSEDPTAIDRIDGPASLFEAGENLVSVFASGTAYVFCPAPHRAQILRIFIRHFCEHPLLPDRTGNLRSSKQIRAAAVFEMYTFCKQRGLREVWAYMWTAWYCPGKYKIMARASQPDFIGRWRTTMSVENFWRNLKHGTLHHLLHPRLDQLVCLIATEIVPAFEAKMQIFDPNYRPGRAKALTLFQRQFKKGWTTLESRALGDRKYQTDVSRWSCSCGQQKYSALLLCKHLVQAVNSPDPAFFREVVRRRTIPFYHHPLLKAKDGSVIASIEDSGTARCKAQESRHPWSRSL